ncbi:hypothetical protein BJF78_24830 [Pseudonocardia sp. CNS-139]|nr:hypothetical protein BJF78_24830 [Pseudonocardia sp. CNS-139]
MGADLGREVDHAAGETGDALAERVQGERHHAAGGVRGAGGVEAGGVAEHPVGRGRVGDDLGAAPPRGEQPPRRSAECAGSRTATGVPGSTSHSSRSRLAALAAQFAVVTPLSSMRSPVASS